MDEVLDRLPGGFLAFGDDSLVKTTNLTLRAMLGHRDEGLVGRHVETILTVPSRIFYQTHVFPLLKMQGHLREVYLSLRSKDGEEIPVLLNATRIESEGGFVNECLLIPMQRRNEYEDEILKAKRKTEEALQERNELYESLVATKQALERHQAELRLQNCELLSLKESLEERVETRTAELNELIKDLQGLNYSIVHDLRAPLRAINSTSSVLISDLGDQLAYEHIRLLQRQKYNSNKMASLVDDLLQLSRLILQPVQRQSVDLSAIVEQNAREAVSCTGRHLLDVEIEQGVEVFADREMASLALRHLIGNAVKYSPAGGRVRFGKIAQPNGFVVEDEGIGMDPQYFAKIFQPFQRLHLDEEYPGNGIGLAIVERVARKHGGRIWVESEPGRGSRFYVTFG